MKRKIKAMALAMALILGLASFSACARATEKSDLSEERAKDTRVLSDNEYTQLNISGTDVLGRTFSSADAEDKELYVGMFYFLWLGQHADEMRGISDVSEITKDGTDFDAFYNVADESSPLNQYHFWGEPIWGYYRSDDEWVIRKQMEMLTMAGVDYLYLDVTNKFLYENVIPFPLFAVFHHTLEVGTVVIGSRHGAVDVCCEDENVVPLCIFAADTDLTFYGLLRLIVGRVTGVDHCHMFLWTLFR